MALIRANTNSGGGSGTITATMLPASGAYYDLQLDDIVITRYQASGYAPTSGTYKTLLSNSGIDIFQITSVPSRIQNGSTYHYVILREE